MITLILPLVLALQQPAAATPAPAPAPAPPRPAQTAPAGAPAPRPAPAGQGQARRPAQAGVTLQVKVTDRSGTPLQGATVSAEGPVSRDAQTDASGSVSLRGVANGTYRIRAEHEESIPLEKEVVIRAGAPSSLEFALTAAPPRITPPQPAPPAEPPPVPAAPAATAGEPRVLSVIDLAERSLGGRDPVKLVPVGCSGLDSTQLLVVRETLNAPAQASVDQMLYVVAGEAMLSLGGRDQAISSGWFVTVPRGMAHTIARRGRNPAILLSVAGGQPCPSDAATTADTGRR